MRSSTQSSHSQDRNVVGIDDSDDDSRRIPPSASRSSVASDNNPLGMKSSVKTETDHSTTNTNVNTKESSVRFDLSHLDANPDKSSLHRQSTSTTQQYSNHPALDTVLSESREGVPFTPSPEIMFLIREHAKTLANLSSISKRLEQLEAKVCDIQRTVTDSKSSSIQLSNTACGTSKESGMTLMPSSGNEVLTGKGASNHILSDDSGGEYSRTTNGTTADEDELISLLDQIVKHSQQIRETQSQQALQQHVLVNSIRPSIPRRENERDHLHIQNDRSVGESVANQGQVIPVTPPSHYGQVGHHLLHHNRGSYAPAVGAVSYPAGYQGRQQYHQMHHHPQTPAGTAVHLSSSYPLSNGYQNNRPYSGVQYSSYPGSPAGAAALEASAAFHQWVPPLGYHFIPSPNNGQHMQQHPSQMMTSPQTMDFSPLMQQQLSVQMSHMQLAGPSVSNQTRD
jgi:hypothetical protein